MGSDIIDIHKGTDCTVAFKMSHGLSNKHNMINSMLKKYYVKDVENYHDHFSWSTFNELTDMVKIQIFPNNASHKAPIWHLGVLSFVIVVYVYILWLSISTNNIFLMFLAGVLLMTVKFMGTTHDSIHFALSSNPKINKIIAQISLGWSLWEYCGWLVHHQQHHEYTGISKSDPDLYHYDDIVGRDDIHDTWKTPYKYQWLTMPFVRFVIPNQFVGQVFVYLSKMRSGKIFKTVNVNSIKSIENSYDNFIKYSLMSASIFVHIILPILLFSNGYLLPIAYFAGAGFLYALLVIPNHGGKNSNRKLDPNNEKYDWAKMQIESSNNFCTQIPYLNIFMGSMNYQIEHHLFPTCCNVHYPKIKKLIKQYCTEKFITYVDQDNLFVLYKNILLHHKNCLSVNNNKKNPTDLQK